MSEQTDNQGMMDFIDLALEDPNLSPESGKSAPPDPGVYIWEVKKAGSDPIKAGGGNNLVLSLEIISDGPMKGRQMRAWYPIKDTAFTRGRMKNLVEALGVPYKFSIQQLVGCTMQAEVVHKVSKETDNRTAQAVDVVRANLVGESPDPTRQAAPAAAQPSRPVVAARRTQPVTATTPNGPARR